MAINIAGGLVPPGWFTSRIAVVRCCHKCGTNAVGAMWEEGEGKGKMILNVNIPRHVMMEDIPEVLFKEWELYNKFLTEETRHEALNITFLSRLVNLQLESAMEIFHEARRWDPMLPPAVLMERAISNKVIQEWDGKDGEPVQRNLKIYCVCCGGLIASMPCGRRVQFKNMVLPFCHEPCGTKGAIVHSHMLVTGQVTIFFEGGCLDEVSDSEVAVTGTCELDVSG